MLLVSARRTEKDRAYLTSKKATTYTSLKKQKNTRMQKGVVFLVNAKIKDCISDRKTYSDRVIKIDLNFQQQEKVTKVMTYARTYRQTQQRRKERPTMMT